MILRWFYYNVEMSLFLIVSPINNWNSYIGIQGLVLLSILILKNPALG